MIRSTWDQRIRRADELAAAHPFAAEVLRFYRRIAGLQKALYRHFEDACDPRTGQPGSISGVINGVQGLVKPPAAEAPSLMAAYGTTEVVPFYKTVDDMSSSRRQPELNLQLLLPKFPEFLSETETFATHPFAEAARRLRTAGESRWRDALTSCWQNATDFTPAGPEPVLAWIFLQPYAEFLADQGERAPGSGAPTVCPFCSAKPVVGVLRPEGDGGKRFLICSLCSTEWRFGRILCPACGEENVEKLAVYTASQFPYVRVEACDSCRRYIKTVDLTKNGHAVPLVDELATIPLNLWAEEHQYTKLQPNLLGI